MATCRDWLATLWSASFRGFPFYAEKDVEKGGRRVVVHQFPMRDDPFLEDLGEDARYYDVTAYVASDLADVESSAFVAALSTEGEGILVLPTFGPINVRAQQWERSWQKDKLGYAAFSVKFVRAGSGLAMETETLLENTVISAVDALETIVGTVFATAAYVLDFADYVISAGVAVIEEVGGYIELIRSTNALFDLDISADVRDAAAELTTVAPELLSRGEGGASAEYATRVFEPIRDMTSVMDASSAYRAFASAADAWPDVAPSSALAPNAFKAASNAREATRVFRVACLCAMAEAAIRIDYPSREEAITARGELAERIEEEMNSAGDISPELFLGLQQLRNSVVAYLSRAIVDLAPVVTVTANRSRPSLYWGWRLYQDPVRQSELVARNKVKHPSFMPLEFEALAR